MGKIDLAERGIVAGTVGKDAIQLVAADAKEVLFGLSRRAAGAHKSLISSRLRSAAFAAKGLAAGDMDVALPEAKSPLAGRRAEPFR
jgi:hypothetical protein